MHSTYWANRKLTHLWNSFPHRMNSVVPSIINSWACATADVCCHLPAVLIRGYFPSRAVSVSLRCDIRHLLRQLSTDWRDQWLQTFFRADPRISNTPRTTTNRFVEAIARHHFIAPPCHTSEQDARCWRTSDVIGLAKAMVCDMDGGKRLPILSDALMDAGCEDLTVLGYCRQANKPAQYAYLPAPGYNWLTDWLLRGTGAAIPEPRRPRNPSKRKAS